MAQGSVSCKTAEAEHDQLQRGDQRLGVEPVGKGLKPAARGAAPDSRTRVSQSTVGLGGPRQALPPGSFFELLKNIFVMQFQREKGKQCISVHFLSAFFGAVVQEIQWDVAKENKNKTYA